MPSSPQTPLYYSQIPKLCRIPSPGKIRPTVIDKSKSIEPIGSGWDAQLTFFLVHGSPNGRTLLGEGIKEVPHIRAFVSKRLGPCEEHKRGLWRMFASFPRILQLGISNTENGICDILCPLAPLRNALVLAFSLQLVLIGTFSHQTWPNINAILACIATTWS